MSSSCGVIQFPIDSLQVKDIACDPLRPESRFLTQSEQSSETSPQFWRAVTMRYGWSTSYQMKLLRTSLMLFAGITAKCLRRTMFCQLPIPLPFLGWRSDSFVPNRHGHCAFVDVAR